MKKILWMHSHFKYWMGGTKLVYQIISRLHKHIPVRVFVEDYSELSKKNFAEAGIDLEKTIGITSTSPRYWLNLPHYIRRNRDAVRRFVDRDTVLVSSMFPMNAVLADFNRPRFQYIFEPFAFIHDPAMINGQPWAKRMFCRYVAWRYRALDIEATRKADKVFTLNDITAAANRNVYGIDSVPTYTGIDTDFFKPYDTPDLAAKYKGRRVLIHSTDFTPVKGTDHALRALVEIKRKYPNVLLLITTTIEDKGGLSKLLKLADRLGVRENVEYLGFLPHRELPRYYSFAEALLQTGVGASAGATSFSLPVKEAMASGTAVIRHPITSEDAEDGVSGFLVDSADTGKYAARVIQLLDDPVRTKEMGRKARERILSRYHWDLVIQTMLEYIR